MLVRDFLFQLEKVREERIVLSSWGERLWGFWDILRHFCDGDGKSCEIIELDKICLMFNWLGWVKRDVHNGTLKNCVGCWILLGDTSAMRVGFVLQRSTIFDE